MSHPSHSDYSFMSDDPQEWTALEYLIFTSPFGLGHIAQRVLLGNWGFGQYSADPHLYMAMAGAQTGAYTAVGWAIAGPSMTPGHMKHVVLGQALKRFPLGAMPAVMLGLPLLTMHLLPAFERSQGSPRLD